MSMTGSLSYLTCDLPGIGGVIKQRPEDFLVEEQPLYEPCGEGEHLYLLVEKNSLTTPEAVHRIAKAFRAARDSIGYAGMKDKHAITRQHFSVWLEDPSDQARALRQLDHDPRLKVLWAEPHRHKLCRGHLTGNRFVIRLRQVAPADALPAKQVLERLISTGIPNFIGEQRFGYRQNSHVLGRLLLLGEDQKLLDQMLGRPGPIDSPALRAGRQAYERGDFAAALESWPRQLRFDRQALDGLRQGRKAAEAVSMIDRAQREFLVSALQSAMFNAVLDRRLRAGQFNRLLPGDLAWKHGSRTVFPVDEQTAAIENAPGGRIATMQVSPSGPLWGMQMVQAQGEAGQVEQQALADQGLTQGQLHNAAGPVAQGRRRPMRVPITDPDLSAGADEHGAYVRLAFELPRGAFATTVLREIMKTHPMAPRPPQGDGANDARTPAPLSHA